MLQKQGSVDIYCVNSPISMQMSGDTNGCCKTLLWWKYAFCFSCAVQTFVYEISWWQASGIFPPWDGAKWLLHLPPNAGRDANHGASWQGIMNCIHPVRGVNNLSHNCFCSGCFFCVPPRALFQTKFIFNCNPQVGQNKLSSDMLSLAPMPFVRDLLQFSL